MRSFSEYVQYRQLCEAAFDDLWDKHNDPESRLLLSKGIHPLTLEPLPAELRPAYNLMPDDAQATQEPAAQPSQMPAPYKMMQRRPDAGQKDKWGRTIYNQEDHPDTVRAQDAVVNKIRRKAAIKGVAHTEPGGGKPHDRFGRKQVYDVQPPQ